VLQDLLNGFVFQDTILPPRQRIIGASGISEEQARRQLESLLQVPGVEYKVDTRIPANTGYYLPRSLHTAGQLGAGLLDYPEDVTLPACPLSGRPLRPHQLRTVAFIRAITPWTEGAIVGADAGCGKTISTLQAFWLDQFAARPVVICGTKKTRGAWVGETRDPAVHYGLSIQPLETETPDLAMLGRHRWFFIHYDILPYWWSAIQATLKPAALVFDESHHLSHPSAQRSGAALSLSRASSVERRVLLTGNPMPNERRDLYAQLAVAQPRQWGWKPDQFWSRYCGMRYEVVGESGQTVPNFDESRVSDEAIVELRARLAGTLLRYTKDVCSGVPSLRIIARDVELDDPEVLADYRAAQRDIASYLRGKGVLPDESAKITFGGITLELSKHELAHGMGKARAYTVLIGLLSAHKARKAVDFALEQLQGASHVVIFTQRVAPAKNAARLLTERGAPVFGPITGEMAQDERETVAAAFAKAERGVCVATMGAAGESINELSIASRGVMVDLDWRPYTLMQAISRLQRDGSAHREVQFIFPICRGTIDEEMLNLLEAKVTSQVSAVPEERDGLRLVDELIATSMRSEEGKDLDALCSALAAVED